MTKEGGKQEVNFDETPHRRSGFFTEENLMWRRLFGAMQSAAAVAMMPLLTFMLRTPYQWLNMLSMSWTTPKIAPFPWGICTPSIHCSLGPHESPTHTASRSVIRFCRVHGRDQQTDRQTDTRHTGRPRYSVCSNRPHLAIVAMRPIDGKVKKMQDEWNDETMK